MWLVEDREVRILSECLMALACLPFGLIMIWGGRGGQEFPDTIGVITTVIGLLPLVFIAALRTRVPYLLTTHRIAHVQDGEVVWSVRYDQISRIRRFGGTLHLRGAGRLTYSVQNLRHAIWLENYLYERS